MGVPAHICAVGLYCKVSRAHLRYARAALATKPRYASLVPKGSLSLTRMQFAFSNGCVGILNFFGIYNHNQDYLDARLSQAYWVFIRFFLLSLNW